MHLCRKNGRQSSAACVPVIDSVLRDPNVVITGCGLEDDLIDLHHHFRGLEARTRLELGLVGATRGRTTGLKTLTRFLLGLQLPKSKRIAMSDWSQVPLSKRQILYSARDAWAGAAIADKLRNIDPDTFSVQSLMERSRSQPSLNELLKKRRTRKQAKTILSLLRSQKRKDSRRPSSSPGKRRVSSWKVDLIRQLKSVIQENKPEKEEAYEVVLPFHTSSFPVASNVSAW